MILSDKDLTGPNDCWLWLAATTNFGHGVFSIKHKWVLAHRVSFFIKNKYLPDKGRMVLHQCENHPCQNPNHLIDGTNSQNQKHPKCLKKHKLRLPSMLGKKGKASPRYGTKHSDETKEKISESMLKFRQLKREETKLVPRHENLLIFKTPES